MTISTHPREGTKTDEDDLFTKYYEISTHPREGTKTLYVGWDR